jgi:hypothetical protein
MNTLEDAFVNIAKSELKLYTQSKGLELSEPDLENTDLLLKQSYGC